MLTEVDEYLALQAGQIFCDCTLGGAGHSAYVGRHLSTEGLLIGIDQDQQAIQAAATRLAAELPGLQTRLLHGNFADLDDLLLSLKLPGIDAFLFDLGTSSYQLDALERGFSYAHEAPLDMRMNPGKQTLTAAEVINTSTEADLARILDIYGEERWSKRIAQAIVKRRADQPYTQTLELVETIRQAIPAATRRTGGNPAKRSFQALRIYINSELDALTIGLTAALNWLNPGGRIVVISYHSLEDRIVKQLFAEVAQGCTCPPEAVICVCGHQSVFEILTRKPETPSAGERQSNPRSASAKLRAIAKSNGPGD
jgi:16S rRNA (cytosine1402-N4)-methyltransferase